MPRLPDYTYKEALGRATEEALRALLSGLSEATLRASESLGVGSRDPRGEAVAERLEVATCGSAPSPGSVPVAVGVPLEGTGELRIDLRRAGQSVRRDRRGAPGRLEPGGARDGVEGGGNGCEPQRQMERNGKAVVGEDQWPERREILEA